MSHDPYTRFVIIGAARSGTTLLQSLLSSHPEIVCLGEVFHLLARRDHDLDQIVADPVDFVSKTIYRPHARHIGAVGYKVLYSQLGAENLFLREMDTAHVAPATRVKRDAFSAFMAETYDLPVLRARFANFVEYLKSDTDLHVVHIQRENKLEMLLSLRQAGLSGAWSSTKGAYSAQGHVLDGEQCEQFFTTAEDREELYRELFQEHPVINVSYRELTSDPEACQGRVQDFLGVQRACLDSPLRKQRRRSAAEVILNYEELKARFSGSPWGRFFR